MVQYKISEKANKLISENEVLYYFSDDDTVSLILCSKDGGEILIRNWTEPNVLKFEGYYSVYSTSSKKTKKHYNWWKKSHKEFTKDKDFFWRSGPYNNERYGNII